MSIRKQDTAAVFSLEHLGLRVDRLIARWQAARTRRAIYNQTVFELSELTDRELADLGISRADIGRIANESADAAMRSRAIV